MRKWIVFVLLKVIELGILIEVPYWMGRLMEKGDTNLVGASMATLWWVGLLSIISISVLGIILLGLGWGLIQLNLYWAERLTRKKGANK